VADPRPRSHLGAVALGLLVTFLWSSSWVLIRWGLDDEGLSPVSFAALRYALAACLLVGWAASVQRHRRNLSGVPRRLLGRLVLLGVVFYALTQGAIFVAIDHQPAATTSLVLAMTPLLVAALSSLSLGEAPRAAQLAGAGLVAGGAWAFFSGDLGATTVGLTAALVGLAANTGASLLGRAVNRRGDVEPLVVTAVSMAVGAVLLLGVGWAVEGLPVVSARAWLIVAWLAAVNTALAFTWWNLSLRRLSALESAVINTSMPVQIAVLAWVFLDEPLGVGEMLGIVLVTGGVVLASAVRAGRVEAVPPAPAGKAGDD
jgi:drug/metabolite transporter (DMT)-like permease